MSIGGDRNSGSGPSRQELRNRFLEAWATYEVAVARTFAGESERPPVRTPTAVVEREAGRLYTSLGEKRLLMGDVELAQLGMEAARAYAEVRPLAEQLEAAAGSRVDELRRNGTLDTTAGDAEAELFRIGTEMFGVHPFDELRTLGEQEFLRDIQGRGLDRVEHRLDAIGERADRQTEWVTSLSGLPQ